MTPRLGVVVVATCLAGGLAAGATLQVENFRPISDAMLLDPDPSDWINWRRTLDGWGYSPLDQITRENVATLQLVWSWAKPPGTDEGTPLVYDGVMYLPGRRGIQALDAATGDFIWEYTPRAREGTTSSDRPPSLARRNIAIYDDKIFAATSDAHLIAIEADTGKPVWDHRVADRALGYSYSSGPIIVKGKVVAGITGCTRYKDDVCFISAHNMQTGRELWRTSTIARPGEAGWRHVGRPLVDLSRRQRRVAAGQLRSADGLDLLVDGAGQAVGERPARH